MEYQFRNLKEEEKHLMWDAPVLVSILIAGADNIIEPSERAEAIRIAHVKSYTERQDLMPYFEKLKSTFETRFDELVKELPADVMERKIEISNRLEKLNNIFIKLDNVFARRFYHSLKDFAFYVATAEGGFLGIGSIVRNEKLLLDLPMIHAPLD